VQRLNHERGIHGPLHADPDGLGTGFAIAFASKEPAQ